MTMLIEFSKETLNLKGCSSKWQGDHTQPVSSDACSSVLIGSLTNEHEQDRENTSHRFGQRLERAFPLEDRESTLHNFRHICMQTPQPCMKRQ
jgi:hypothetical protein